MLPSTHPQVTRPASYWAYATETAKVEHGFFSLEFGQANLHDRPDAVTIAGEVRAIASLGLETVEIEDRSGTTAYHVPEAVLAIYDPAGPPAVRQRFTPRGLRPRGRAGTPADTWRRPAGLHGEAQHAPRRATDLTHPASRPATSSSVSLVNCIKCIKGRTMCDGVDGRGSTSKSVDCRFESCRGRQTLSTPSWNTPGPPSAATILTFPRP